MLCKLDILILVQFVASACQVELVFCVGTHYVPGHRIRSYKLAERSTIFTKFSYMGTINSQITFWKCLPPNPFSQKWLPEVLQMLAVKFHVQL